MKSSVAVNMKSAAVSELACTLSRVISPEPSLITVLAPDWVVTAITSARVWKVPKAARSSRSPAEAEKSVIVSSPSEG